MNNMYFGQLPSHEQAKDYCERNNVSMDQFIRTYSEDVIDEYFRQVRNRNLKITAYVLLAATMIFMVVYSCYVK